METFEIRISKFDIEEWMKPQRRVWRRGMCVLLAGAVLAMLGIAADRMSGAEGRVEAGQPATKSAEQLEPQRLVGRWGLPDGAHGLDVREVLKNGSLKAAYFVEFVRAKQQES